MKKISFLFLFFIIVLCCFSIKVKAYTNNIGDLYVQMGVGSDEMLNEEGYDLIAGEVNWDKEGEYFLTYIDENKVTYNKKVYIIDDEYYFIKNSNLINFDGYENYEIVEVYYLSESSFYLICNYQEPNSTYYDQEKVAILFYENYKYSWVYRYYDYSRYVDSYFDGEDLIVTALIYNEDNNYINSILLLSINSSREVRYKEIKSDLSCISYGVYMYEGYIYLFTRTKGNKYDYENINPGNGNKIILLKLIPITLEIVSFKLLDEIDDVIVIDTYFHNDRLTINVQFKNKMIIDAITYTNCIYEYDSKLNFVEKYLYNLEFKDYKGYAVLSDDICFFSINNNINNNSMCIQYLNKEVLNKQIFINNGSIYKITDMEILTIKNNTLHVSLASNSNYGSHFLGYASVNSTEGLTLYSSFEKDNCLISSGCFFGKIVNTFKIKDLYYTRITDLVSMLDIDKVEKERDSFYKKVEVNFNMLNPISYKKEGDQSKYGIYKNINKYIDVFKNEYYFEEIIKTKLDINVSNGACYQCGYKIIFNGTGILNGNEVFGEITPKDIGKYLLVIKGENADEVSYNFEIKDLTINYTERQEVQLTIDKLEVYPQIAVNKHYNNYNLEINEYDKNEDIVPIVMSLLVLALMGLIFVRKKV